MRIVEGSDVVVDRRPGFTLRGPRPAVDELGLQRREEAFRDGVVPAVTYAAHAAHDAARGELRPVEVARVLTATVGPWCRAYTRSVLGSCRPPTLIRIPQPFASLILEDTA